MFLIPVSILYGANVSFGDFIKKNLIPVTLGNAISAIIFVCTLYWYIYDFPLRWPMKQKPAPAGVQLESPPSSPSAIAADSLSRTKQSPPPEGSEITHHRPKEDV